MADEIPSPRPGRPDPFSILWRLVAAPQTLMILLGLIALVLAVGSLIPQIPSSARADPLAWLAILPGVPGRIAGVLWALRMVDLAQALWFRLLLALTGVALVLRMAEASELAWRASGHSHWNAASFRFWAGHAAPVTVALSLDPAPLSASGVPADAAAASLTGAGAGLPTEPLPALEAVRAWAEERLAAHRVRSAAVADYPVPSQVIGRRVWALWANPVVCAGFLASLVGLLWLSTRGWQGEDWQLSPGEARPVGHNTAYSLRLDAFDVGQGSPQSRVSWLQGETELRQAHVQAGRPAVLGGLAARQVGYLPWLEVRGWDEAGRPLVLQTEGEPVGLLGQAQAVFADAQSQPVLFLPQQDSFLVFRFSPAARLPTASWVPARAACAAGRPSVSVDWARSDGTGRRTLRVLQASGTVKTDGLRFEVDMSYRPILRLDYRPGMLLILLGLVGALVAQSLRWVLAPRLAWLAFSLGEGQAVQAQAVLLPGAGDIAWLRRLAHVLAVSAGAGLPTPALVPVSGPSHPQERGDGS